MAGAEKFIINIKTSYLLSLKCTGITVKCVRYSKTAECTVYKQIYNRSKGQVEEIMNNGKADGA